MRDQQTHNSKAPKFPHICLKSEPGNRYKLLISHDEGLDLGEIEPEKLKKLFISLKAINLLVNDLTMISSEQE